MQTNLTSQCGIWTSNHFFFLLQQNQSFRADTNYLVDKNNFNAIYIKDFFMSRNFNVVRYCWVLQVSFLYPIRLEQVGWWRWSTAEGARSSLTRPLYRDLSLSYSDFSGRQLTVAMLKFWPTFQAVTEQDGTIRGQSGWDVQLLNTLANKLNFT